MKKFSKTLLILLISFGLFAFLILPNIALGDWEYELQRAEGGSSLIGGGTESSGREIETTISTIINVALSFVGVVFLILMVYSGFMWMLARGNEQQIEKAKKLIEAAVIGLIIVLSAYAISHFVIQRLAG